jgi:hypothetical protein
MPSRRSTGGDRVAVEGAAGDDIEEVGRDGIDEAKGGWRSYGPRT